MDKLIPTRATIRLVSQAFFALTFALLAGGVQAGENFESTDFLAWKPANQAFYIEASVGMGSLIAAQMDKEKAGCIDDWYYDDEATANARVIKVMQQYPSYHPRGIILAVLEKECGAF